MGDRREPQAVAVEQVDRAGERARLVGEGDDDWLEGTGGGRAARQAMFGPVIRPIRGGLYGSRVEVHHLAHQVW
jgi:hypothetical protein